MLSILPAVSTLSAFWGFQSPSLPSFRGEIVRPFPHDTAAFTQGLFYEDGDVLVESESHRPE